MPAGVLIVLCVYSRPDIRKSPCGFSRQQCKNRQIGFRGRVSLKIGQQTNNKNRSVGSFRIWLLVSICLLSAVSVHRATIVFVTAPSANIPGSSVDASVT